MKANELRVGNYVKGIGHNISWLVEGIETDYIHSSNAWRLLSSFEPIPLNTNWLLKLGFKYNNYEELYQKDIFDIDIIDDVYCHFYMNEYGDWYRNIKYVHQLQNLYFALTGEELTIKC
jgi:hypothetical protein